jgi:hypothetical protein
MSQQLGSSTMMRTGGCSCHRQQVRPPQPADQLIASTFHRFAARTNACCLSTVHLQALLLLLLLCQWNKLSNRMPLSCAAGGSVALPIRSQGQPGNQLFWHLHNHTTSTLTLAEVSLSNGQVGQGVRLHIPSQVFSALAVDASAGDACYLFLLLSSRSVGVLRLPNPRQQQQQRPASGSSSNRSIPSVLDSVHAHSLLQLHLPQQLSQLGVPTALAAVDGHLCIGGSEGGVTCLPLSALTSEQAPAQGSVLQLNPSNLIVQMRRRMGFASSSSVVAALPVRIPAAAGGQQQESLLVVHEDGSCHQWFVSSSRQGFSQSLASDAAARQLRPNRVLLCYPGESTRRSGSSSSSSATAGSWDVVLVWDVSMADGGSQSDVRILPLRLQANAAAAAGAAGGGVKLEALMQQPQQLQLEWPDALLLDARVEGQQLLLLIGTKARASHVVAYGVKDWTYQGRCQLLQQRGSGEWGVKEVGK